jgi:hypothetical protein
VKPAVYIETTVISYLTARPSRDLIVAAHQQLTVDWWENARANVECFISPFVIQEASRGDKDAAQRRIEAISDIPVLELNDEIRELATKYFVAISIPEKAKVDAFHLSVAVWHRMDYLLSWNCKHIASGRVRKTLQEVNEAIGIRTPVICTPEELMEV